MPKPLRRLTAVLACLAMATSSTAALAADSSASWSALSALSTSSEQSTCSSHRDGYKDPCGYFGGWIPLGVIVAAGILAFILATSHHHARGRGFSPS